MKLKDGFGEIITTTAAWCRKSDCKYHPSKKIFKNIKRCMICKHFVSKEMYIK